MKLTTKEYRLIQKNHPDTVTENCEHCGGYQTVLKEFFRSDMGFTKTCKQCGATKTWKLEQPASPCEVYGN